jgi:hypothetical protein
MSLFLYLTILAKIIQIRNLLTIYFPKSTRKLNL